MMTGQGNRSGYYLLYLFMTGLFLGILFVNVRYDFWMKEDGLLNFAMLEQLRESNLNGNYLFGYILKHRITTVFIIGMLVSTIIGLPILYGYVCYLGISAGCILSVAVFRYGIRGLFFMAASIFPQAFLLIPGYLLLFSWGLECNKNLYGKNVNVEGYHLNRKQQIEKSIARFLGMLLFLIAGCVLESYVNPKMLHFILKIF